MVCSEATQPAAAVTPCAMGANTNWPNDPPALTMPMAMPLCCGGMRRTVAAIRTEGPASPAPPAASTPMARMSPAVELMKGTIAVPIATIRMPRNSTLPAP